MKKMIGAIALVGAFIALGINRFNLHFGPPLQTNAAVTAKVTDMIALLAIAGICLVVAWTFRPNRN